jgi:hypothetical protein
MSTSPYWPMVKARQFDEVPDTYLDWVRDQVWCRKETVEAINKELATRKRSNFHVPDRFGKIID